MFEGKLGSMPVVKGVLIHVARIFLPSMVLFFGLGFVASPVMARSELRGTSHDSALVAVAKNEYHGTETAQYLAQAERREAHGGDSPVMPLHTGSAYGLPGMLIGCIALMVVPLLGICVYLLVRSRHSNASSMENDVFHAELLNAMPSPVFIYRRTGEFVGANQAFTTLMCVSGMDDIINRRPAEISGRAAEDLANLMTRTSESLALVGGKSFDEVRIRTSAVTTRPYFVSQATFGDTSGGDLATVGVMTDISKQKVTEQELKRFRTALDDSTDAVVITDSSGKLEYVNAVFGYWFGFTSEQLDAIELDAIYGGNGVFASYFDKIMEGEPVTGELRLTTYYAKEISVSVRGSAIFDDEFEIIGALFLHTDITEQKRMEAELEQLSLIDGLTGIHNRRAFDKRLAQEWRRSRRDGEVLFLIILDIDAFKLYNDHYGHQAGDSCLKAVATGIKETFRRPRDFVARYGGEEFAIIMSGIDEPAARAQAERLRGHIESLALPHEESPTGSFVTASMGLAATSSENELSVEELIGAADQALYRAKERGRNRVCRDGESD